MNSSTLIAFRFRVAKVRAKSSSSRQPARMQCLCVRVCVFVCMCVHPITASQAQGIWVCGDRAVSAAKESADGDAPLPLPTWPVGRSPPYASAMPSGYGEATYTSASEVGRRISITACDLGQDESISSRSTSPILDDCISDMGFHASCTR